MMRVATIAVALGIVVMMITISIIGGFKSQINSKLSGLSGHIVATNHRGVSSSMSQPIEDSDVLCDMIAQLGDVRCGAYILRSAIARGGGVIDGVVIKGVDSMYNRSFFAEYMMGGELPMFGESQARREVLISSDLSRDLSLEVGSRLDLIFADDLSAEVDMLTFKVAGVFSAGVGEIERRMIIGDIETLRKINGWHEREMSGREIWIQDIDRAPELAEILNKKIIFAAEEKLDNIVALSIEELYPSLFDWLKTHDVNGVVVISIMLIVAIFNMITALLILVLERSRMIGILKSLGMDNGALRRIFLYRALRIIVKGVLWGNAIALIICGVQSHWGVLKLEASGYMLSVVPIELRVWWIVALNVGVVAVILAVMTIPTRIVASIRPDEIVKYK